MDTLRPDERAAGVISGADPYRELELYLEKVNEEIGEVFDRWRTTSAIPIPSPGSKGSKDLHQGAGSPPQPPKRRRSKGKKLCNGDQREPEAEVSPVTAAQVKARRAAHNGVAKSETAKHDHSISEWSDSLLAEFNSIIANELNELQSIADEGEDVTRDQTSSLKGASRHDEGKVARNSKKSSSLRSKERRDEKNEVKVGKRSFLNDNHHKHNEDKGVENGQRKSPLKGKSRRAEDKSVRNNIIRSALPHDDNRQGDDDEVKHVKRSPLKGDEEEELRSNKGSLTSKDNNEELTNHENEGKVFNDASPTSKQPAMKLRISRSRSWDNQLVNDAYPSSPGEGTPPASPCASETSGSLHRRAKGLGRVLRKARGQFPNIPGPGDAVLVRVASLPDAELLHLSSSADKKPPRKECSCISPLATTSSAKREKPRKVQDRAKSEELLLQNGHSHKATSSSSEDVLEARTSGVMSLPRKVSDSHKGTPSSSEDLLESSTSGEISIPRRARLLVDRSVATDDSPWLPDEQDTEEEASSPGRSGSGELPAALHCLLSQLRPRSPVHAATQTSPPLSRSSSFTWVSDCSSSLLLEDDGSSSSSSPDYVSSRDSLSDSPEGSAGTPEREEPESGIGTASPPRCKEHRQIAHPGAVASKARRKEAWERLRRRQEVWVRHENVETQTGPATTLPLSRARVARPQCLPVRSTPSPVAQPGQASPSSASLKLSTAPLVAELGNKSSSAPLLAKQGTSPGQVKGGANTRILTQPRSQSERHLAEIEAAEACKWLRAAGFPQYAQMYEDLQFPIDVSGVQKDHPFLDPDSLQSLFRRLHALNRCAKMKVDNLPKSKGDDSDEDDNCALSENWTFQPESRRWSRVCDVTAQHAERLQALTAASQAGQDKPAEVEPEFPGDRLLDPGDEDEEEEDYDPDGVPVISSFRYGSLPPGSLTPGDSEMLAVRFRRTGSERLRDGAKALLRRMESLKSRRRKRQNREQVVISGPQVLDVMTMQQRMKDLNCVDVSPDLPPTGLPTPSSPTGGTPGGPGGDDTSDGSSTTPPNPRGRSKNNRSRRLLRRAEDVGALSDSEVQPTSWRHQYLKDANSNHTKVLEFVDGRSRGPQDQEPAQRVSGSGKPQARAGSLNLGKDSQRYRDKLQQAFHKDATVSREKSGSSELMGSQESSSTLASQADSDHDDPEVTPRHKAVVVRWHSFQRGSSRPDSCLFRTPDSGQAVGARSIGALSCGQLLVLRKLALLKLTACMERYCPTHRTGWNWELPKFIRKIKAPDYKDKTVFGVPLLLSLQRNGQALPKCIQAALRWLRVNALDQVGIFRKSGVRSRIQKLKLMTETQGEAINYEGQQAYDVADMVKQYFRELPEALLTNKLSETFIAIFQYVPVNLRREAVQCVLLLLPDEHREALQTLLEFLYQVSARSACNQMTPSNLAVCLAPSLFHLHHAPSASSRSASASPRRRKTVGVPDSRELNENKAAHDCLLYLIKEHKDLFVVPEEMLAQCHFNYMEESVPVALEELGSEFQQDWRGYLYACTTALLKEAREKSRGWVTVSCSTDQQVEMAYKKVGDGHPLRLWRVSTEVEAPPLELLQRVLRERHVWDYSLLKWRVVARLDPQVEVFQYVCANMAPLSAKDYCVLRSWRTDLPKGACVIVETSVEHAEAPVMLGGVRGIVLASRYLIEPCGSGKSRIMHLSRVDTKGRTPEWYNKSYGHICALYLTRIRTSFKHNTDGPESKV